MRRSTCGPMERFATRCCFPAEVLEVEDNSQRRVYASQLVEVEISDTFAETTRVNRRGLFRQDPSDAAGDLYLRAKACRPC
ncbi:MAG: hypothetical protein JWR32_4586 [Mycobacterium sp.]|nr:hypothetical protein [Mycobacterium sp.]